VATARPKNSAAAQPPKFKVGDEVIRTDRPFELREIITQLPVTDAGERQYRIGPPPMRGGDGTEIKAPAQANQRNVGENQLMKLEEVRRAPRVRRAYRRDVRGGRGWAGYFPPADGAVRLSRRDASLCACDWRQKRPKPRSRCPPARDSRKSQQKQKQFSAWGPFRKLA
jgi:hypothetical protein